MRINVDFVKTMLPKDTRVELEEMDDPQAPPSGTKGTAVIVDDLGTVFVEWDNGSTLGVIPGKDRIRKITDEREGND